MVKGEHRRRLMAAARRAATFIAIVPITPIYILQSSANPFAGRRLYIDPNSNAARQAETLKRSKPQDAKLVAAIAHQPVAKWIGGWVGNIGREVSSAVSTITGSGALPVF